MSVAKWTQLIIGLIAVVGLASVVAINTYGIHKQPSVPDTPKSVPVPKTQAQTPPAPTAPETPRAVPKEKSIAEQLLEKKQQPTPKPGSTPGDSKSVWYNPLTWSWETELPSQCCGEYPQAVVYNKLQTLPIDSSYHIIPLEGCVEYMDRRMTRKHKECAGDPDTKVPFEAQWIRSTGEKATVMAKFTPKPKSGR